MIYLKRVTRKLNKYIEDKNKRKYKKLKDNVSKTLEVTEKCLFRKQSNIFFS